LNEDPNRKDRLVEETKEYYRQRASQYADWAHRTGAYEGGSEPEASWFDEAKILLERLETERLVGKVLEIACGIGVWTEVLVKSAGSVTALDSSREMIQRNIQRLRGNPKVKYVLADFYDWNPDSLYDAVTFSFWISHVPSSRLNEFVSKVSSCLSPKGRVFFVDQQNTARKNEVLDTLNGEAATRKLDDGRTFNVIKHFYSPEEIRGAFLKNGIKTRVTSTSTHFYYVDGRKCSQYT
jgi:demethylmenaquinone methyltransferase/2-methoxy-6-polyprenyl-1,4-benzoquinol methylase